MIMPGTPVPESYVHLIRAANAGRLFWLFPATIRREGDRVIYYGLRHRISSRAVSVDEDLALLEDTYELPMPHVAMPLMWAWAVGARFALPMHPAGEFRAPFPGVQ